MAENNKDFINALVWGIIGLIGFVVILFLVLIIFFGVKL